jgi:hypothetical protein
LCSLGAGFYGVQRNVSTKENTTTLMDKSIQRGAGTPQSWYTMTKPDDRQGLIADENTGANIAVSYDPKDAQLIASAPAMLSALKCIRGEMDALKRDEPNRSKWSQRLGARFDWNLVVYDVIAKAEGSDQ